MGEQQPSDKPSAYDLTSVSNTLPQAPLGRGDHSQPPSSHPHPHGPHPALQQMHPVAHFNAQTPLQSQYYAHGQYVPHYYGEGSAYRPGANMYQPHVQFGPPGSAYYYQQAPANFHGIGPPLFQPRMPSSATGSAHGNDLAFSDSPSEARGTTAPTLSRMSISGPADSRSGSVRGPPRKPRQSGHAIWIGNLPPQTDLMNLVQHVCKETSGLQSLFLISKSNCAFANYKDETASSAAQQKLHDSRFQSVRLVSRIRKSPTENGPSPATLSEDSSKVPVTISSTEIPPPEPHSAPKTESAGSEAPLEAAETPEPAAKQNKFFILKSLTVNDLDTSVRKGIWATQPHNEDILNNAFKNAENVFLIFSANKSGEYYGYAKMSSQIDQDPAAAIEFAPATHAPNDAASPQTIPTEATEFVPRGTIIDDSARGTIFWEVDKEDDDAQSDSGSEISIQDSNPVDETGKTWGKPFQLEWLSTTRLPFYRTRGLRNPWNANREVKIARDGTELEPSVGRKLIGLFNNAHTSGPNLAPAMRPPPHMVPMSGYTQVRPYGQ